MTQRRSQQVNRRALALLLANVVLVRLAAAHDYVTAAGADVSAPSQTAHKHVTHAVAGDLSTFDQINSLDFAATQRTPPPLTSAHAHVARRRDEPVNNNNNNKRHRRLARKVDTSKHKATNETASKRDSRSRTHTQLPSALATEAGNLLSVGGQLMKLARAGIAEPTSSYYGGGSGSSAGFGWPSSGWLASASGGGNGYQQQQQYYAGDVHEMAHAGHEWPTMMAKSGEWFWTLVPAAIVVGAGVILGPLLAAWLVSHAISQNSLTLAAGRRRRRRDVAEQLIGKTLPSLLEKLAHTDDFARFELALNSVLDHIASAQRYKHS